MHPSWADVLFLSFGAMCQQGAPAIPYGISGRIITLLTFLALMFLYTSYSANIVALLQSSSNSIKSLNDLLHSRLTLGVDDTVFNHFYFPVSIFLQLSLRFISQRRSSSIPLLSSYRFLCLLLSVHLVSPNYLCSLLLLLFHFHFFFYYFLTCSLHSW